MSDRLVVAVPVKDEAERLPACLHALTHQDAEERPVILVLVNNSSDVSAAIVRGVAATSRCRVIVEDVALADVEASAGGARRLAMHKAADNLPRQTLQPDLRVFNGLTVFFQHDALSWVIEFLLAQPHGVRLGLCATAREDAAPAEQERLHVLSCATQMFHRRLPCPDQLTYGLVLRVRYTHRRELASAMQFRERQGIAAIGLYPVSGTLRDE